MAKGLAFVLTAATGAHPYCRPAITTARAEFDDRWQITLSGGSNQNFNVASTGNPANSLGKVGDRECDPTGPGGFVKLNQTPPPDFTQFWHEHEDGHDGSDGETTQARQAEKTSPLEELRD
jgi:hypothetical protein